MKFLGVDRYEHFGSSPSFFERDDYEAHIPVRDPMDVARSWAMRGKPLDELLMRYEAMMRFIANNKKHVLYVTETLPDVIGDGEWTEQHASVDLYQTALIKRITEISEQH